LDPTARKSRQHDLPDTTDAGLEFTVPLDGAYQAVVSEHGGQRPAPRQYAFRARALVV